MSLSVAPGLVALVRGGEELAGAVIAGLVLGGAVTAFAAPDGPGGPGGNLLAAVPVPLWRRWSERLVLVALLAAAVWGAALALILARDPAAGAEPLARLAELGAVTGLSAAAGAAADRQGTPVAGAALAGPGFVLVCSALAQRFPAVPMVGDRGDRGTWAVLAVAAWVAAVWERRDPYGFALRRRSR